MSNITREMIETLVRQVVNEKLMVTKSISNSGVGVVKLPMIDVTEEDRLDTGNPNDKVYTKDLFSLDESPRLGCGLMFMEDTTFDWTLNYDEIDYVINIGELKNGNYAYIEDEMEQIVKLCRDNNVLIKVIFENCYLEKDEIVKVAEIAKKVKPDFIKTSTGFGPSGATVEDVKLMKETVGDEVKVKAAGGIRDLETCLAMIEAGAERIGCSKSIEITEAYKKTVK